MSDSEKLFGKKTIPEDVRSLASELFEVLIEENRGKIEIEGRIGKLLDKSSDNRWKFPIASDTLLSSKSEQFKFEPRLSVGVFEQLNILLNEKVRAAPNEITYKRTREIDRFYRNRESGVKTRVTLDPETMQPLRAIIKEKKKSFDFMCPIVQLDYRITISLEIIVNSKAEEWGTPLDERVKDRMSYEFGMWKIDITVVKTFDLDEFEVRKNEKPEEAYEVEMEVNPDVLFAEKAKLARGGSFDMFTKMCSDILSNIRSLVERCEPPKIKPMQQQIQVPQVRHTPFGEKKIAIKRKHDETK
jgi:hypothetical protein